MKNVTILAVVATLCGGPAFANCATSINNTSATTWTVTADTTAGGGDVRFGPVICNRDAPQASSETEHRSAKGPNFIIATLNSGCGMQVFYENSFLGFSHGWIRFDIPGRSPPVSQFYNFDDNWIHGCPSIQHGGATPNINLNEPIDGGAQIYGDG